MKSIREKRVSVESRQKQNQQQQQQKTKKKKKKKKKEKNTKFVMAIYSGSIKILSIDIYLSYSSVLLTKSAEFVLWPVLLCCRCSIWQ